MFGRLVSEWTSSSLATCIIIIIIIIITTTVVSTLTKSYVVGAVAEMAAK